MVAGASKAEEMVPVAGLPLSVTSGELLTSTDTVPS
jgi:hypothetical protein